MLSSTKVKISKFCDSLYEFKPGNCKDKERKKMREKTHSFGLK